MRERSIRAVSKTVIPFTWYRGFESPSFRLRWGFPFYLKEQQSDPMELGVVVFSKQGAEKSALSKTVLQNADCQRYSSNQPVFFGKMSEWFKVHAWKACTGETLSGVRIPLFPLVQMLCTLQPENPARAGRQQRYLACSGAGVNLDFSF